MFALSAVIIVGFLFLLKSSYTEGFQVPDKRGETVYDFFTLVSRTSNSIPILKEDLVKAAGGDETKQIADIRVFALNKEGNNFNVELPQKIDKVDNILKGSGGANPRLEFVKTPADGTSQVIQFSDSSSTTKLPINLNDTRLSDGLKLVNYTVQNLKVNKRTNLTDLYQSSKYENITTPTSFSIKEASKKNLLVRFILRNKPIQ